MEHVVSEMGIVFPIFHDPIPRFEYGTFCTIDQVIDFAMGMDISIQCHLDSPTRDASGISAYVPEILPCLYLPRLRGVTEHLFSPWLKTIKPRK
jgi:hypothetical protein